MKVVKEYTDEGIRIRIHDDFIENEEKTKINELIISLIIDKIDN